MNIQVEELEESPRIMKKGERSTIVTKRVKNAQFTSFPKQQSVHSSMPLKEEKARNVGGLFHKNPSANVDLTVLMPV